MKSNNNNNNAGAGRQPRAWRYALTLRTLLRVAMLLVGGAEGGYQDVYRLQLDGAYYNHHKDRVARDDARRQALRLSRRLRRWARRHGVPGFLVTLLEDPGSNALALDGLFRRLYAAYPHLRAPLKRILRQLLRLLRALFLEFYYQEPGTDSSDDEGGPAPGSSFGVGPQAAAQLDQQVGMVDLFINAVGH